MSEVLLHMTRETSDVRRSPLAEVRPEALQALQWRLTEIFAHAGGVHDIGSGWMLQVAEGVVGDGRPFLDARAWPAGADLKEPAPVRFTVMRSQGTEPVLVTKRAGLADFPAPVALEAADLERCIAWAWLTMCGPDTQEGGG